MCTGSQDEYLLESLKLKRLDPATLAKLTRLERELSDESGSFSLFVLFARADGPGRWDLVVSAPWLPEADPESLKRMVNRLSEHLSKPELELFAGVLILAPDNPMVREINVAFTVEHSQSFHLSDCRFSGIGHVAEMYIITSKAAPGNRHRPG